MPTGTHAPWIPAELPYSWYRGPGRAPTDLQALQARPDLQLLPLHRDTPEILEFLPALGPLILITRSAGVECAAWSPGIAVQRGPGATALWGQSGNLGRVGSGWRHSALALDRRRPGHPPSLMLFGPWGELLLQVSLTDDSRAEGLQALVDAHQGCGHCLHPGPRPDPEPAAAGSWSGAMLREAWGDAGSPRDLEVRLAGLGLTPLLAVRALDGLYTHPLGPEALATLLGRLGHAGIPLHVECGGPHGAQALSGPVIGLARNPDHWAIRFPEAQIRLDLDHFPRVWSTTRPGISGGRPRVEGFDDAGERVLSIASHVDTPDDWERLLPAPGWAG